MLLGFSDRTLEANKLHESDLPVNIIKVHTIRIECNLTRGSYYQNRESHTHSIINITVNTVDQENRLIDFNGQTINVRLALKKDGVSI